MGYIPRELSDTTDDLRVREKATRVIDEFTSQFTPPTPPQVEIPQIDFDGMLEPFKRQVRQTQEAATGLGDTFGTMIDGYKRQIMGDVPSNGVQPVMRGAVPQGGGYAGVTPDEPVTRDTVTRAAAAALSKAGLPAEMAPYIAGIAINEGILQPGTIARDHWSVGGVKAPGSAGVVTVPTREVINGQSVMQTASFGKFNSMQEGMDALATFVRDSPRFGPIAKQAAETGDYSSMIEGFRQKGYATDPNWTKQVNSIAGSLPASQAAPQSMPAPGQSTSAGFDAASISKQWAGKPYVFGGAGGRSAGVAPTDCSGFVAEVFKEQGLDLPAHTDAAYNYLQKNGQAVDPKDARPSDVVFYMGAGTGGAITHHMGLYAGPGKVLDMSVAGGGGVKERPIGHAGEYVIMRDPRLNPPVPPQRAEEAPAIVPTGIAERTGGQKIKGMDAQAAVSQYGGLAMEDVSGQPEEGAGAVRPVGAGEGSAGGSALLGRDIRGDYAPRDSVDALESESGLGVGLGGRRDTAGETLASSGPPVRDDYARAPRAVEPGDFELPNNGGRFGVVSNGQDGYSNNADPQQVETAPSPLTRPVDAVEPGASQAPASAGNPLTQLADWFQGGADLLRKALQPANDAAVGALNAGADAIGERIAGPAQSVAESPPGRAAGAVWNATQEAGRRIEPFTATGMSREQLGREQQIKEQSADETRIQALYAQLDEAERIGDVAAAEQIKAHILPIEQRLNAAYRESPIEASTRNPQTEPTTNAVSLGQGAWATMAAPSIGSGIARNLAGAVIDPTGQAFSAGIEAAPKAVGALTRAARTAPSPSAGIVSRAQADEAVPIPPRAGSLDIDRLRPVQLEDGKWTVVDGRGDFAEEIRGYNGKRSPVTFLSRDAAEDAARRYEAEFRDYSREPMPQTTVATPGTHSFAAAARAVGAGVGAGYQESQQEGSTPESVLRAGVGGALTSAGNTAAGKLIGRKGVTLLSRAVESGGGVPDQNIKLERKGGLYHVLRDGKRVYETSNREDAFRKLDELRGPRQRVTTVSGNNDAELRTLANPKTPAEAWEAVTETIKPESASPLPEKITDFAKKLQPTITKNWFDATKPLRDITQDAEKALGRKLLPHENAWLQARLLPGTGRAVEEQIAENLGPAVKGLDDSALEQLNGRLAALDAIEKAKSVGQRVEAATYKGAMESDVPIRATAVIESASKEVKQAQAALDKVQGLRNTAREPEPEAFERMLSAAQRKVDQATNRLQRAQAVNADAQAARQGSAMERSMQRGGEIVAGRKFGQFTAPDAQAALDYLDSTLSPFQKTDLEKRTQLVREHVSGLRQRMVDSGLISQEAADSWAQKNPNYTPIRFLDWLDDAERRVGASASLSVSDNGVQGLSEMGASYQRKAPLEALLDATFSTERRAARNEAAQAFANYTKIDPTFKDLMRPANEAAVNYLGAKGIARKAPNETTFSMWEKGVKHDFYMDKSLADAIRQDRWQMGGPAGTAIQAASAAFRAGATGSNVLFLIPNATGDALTAMVRGESVGSLLRGYKEAFTHGPEYKAFLEAGGGYSGMIESGTSRQSIDRLRGSISKTDQLKAYASWVNPLKIAQELGERVEMAPRVGMFGQALREGASTPEAALAGRDITMDFARAGLWARAINQVVPFFNVGLQAPAQVARLFAKTAPGEVARPGTAQALARVSGLVVAPTIALEAYNRQDPTYKDVPQYDKDRALIIMDPRGPGEIDPDTGRPTPRYALIGLREWTPFAIATREAIGRSIGDEDRDWRKVADAVLRNSSPVSLQEGVSAVLPPWITVPFEMQTNYDTFRDRAIIPESVQDRLPEEQYTSTTSETSKLIGRAIQKPPAMIEHAIRGAGTGVAGQVLGASDMALRAVGAAPPAEDRGRVKDIPVVGGLAGRFYREQGGEITNRQREQNAAQFETIMRSAGLKGDEVQPVGWTIGDTKLTSAEQSRYQTLFNGYFDEMLSLAKDHPNWDDAINRPELARKAASQARKLAGQEVLADIDPGDRLERKAS